MTRLMTRRGWRRAAAWAACCALLALARPAAASDCEDGTPRVGWLGVDLAECNCTYSFDSENMTSSWRFGSEPRIGGIRSESPAEGKLSAGDVVAAIDGALITTAEGGRRFAGLRPGVPVTLTVRREGRELDVQITPGSICLGQILAHNAPQMTPMPAPMPDIPDIAPAPPTPPTPPAPLSRRAPRAAMRDRGWLGVGLNFENCEGQIDPSPATWCFGTMPEIYYVDPGSPAAIAGLQRGDVITHIDGVSILTLDGGKRFTAIRPGQRVRFTVRRGNTTRNAQVIPARRGESSREEVRPLLDMVRGLREGANSAKRLSELRRLESELRRLSLPEPPATESERRLRYAGSVGTADVVVRGVGNVVVDDSGDEIVIVTRDATIRVKPSGKATPRPRK